ncbi:uncharacterized protein [Littorina saxatilis]|uniref:uncharacterized protein n=1 Tax=Littorina saxatilis TaxID=31220 RepID=UPI0038B49443
MFYAGRGPKRHLTHLIALLAVMATQVRFQALSKELELNCDRFVDNETAHCSCSIDKTAADSKCGDLSEGELTKVQISLRPNQYKASPDQDVTLCNFVNFSLRQRSTAVVSNITNCPMKQPDQGSIYVMKTSFVVKRERHENLYVTCWPGCNNGVTKAGLLPSNRSAVLIKFDNPPTEKTSTSKPFSILFISAVAGVAAVATLIVGGLCIYFGIKRHNRNAWTPMPPTKRICYDGPLPVQLPRTPSPKSSKTGSVSNPAESHSPIAPSHSPIAPSHSPIAPPEETPVKKTSNEEDKNSLMSSEVDESEAGGETDASGVPDT